MAADDMLALVQIRSGEAVYVCTVRAVGARFRVGLSSADAESFDLSHEWADTLAEAAIMHDFQVKTVLEFATSRRPLLDAAALHAYELAVQ